MKGKKIPTRWKNYLPMGCRVAGTRFLPFKVPLKLELCQSQPESERFTPGFLLESTPKLKAVIDLTNTDRYYNSEEFTSRGVLYKKVNVRGGGSLPSERESKQFFDAVDQLYETLKHDSDALIGVHCTHGLNRTGYLICKYMVSRMKIDPQQAINNFQEARGHEIERRNYVQNIIEHSRSQPVSQPVHTPAEVNWRSEPRQLPSGNNWREKTVPSRSSSRSQTDSYNNYKYNNQTYNNQARRLSRSDSSEQDRRFSRNNYEQNRQHSAGSYDQEQRFFENSYNEGRQYKGSNSSNYNTQKDNGRYRSRFH